jgi:hypothetical protein
LLEAGGKAGGFGGHFGGFAGDVERQADNDAADFMSAAGFAETAKVVAAVRADQSLERAGNQAKLVGNRETDPFPAVIEGQNAERARLRPRDVTSALCTDTRRETCHSTYYTRWRRGEGTFVERKCSKVVFLVAIAYEKERSPQIAEQS